MPILHYKINDFLPMSAPFRIVKSGTEKVASRRGNEEFKNYLDRLTKMIPSEVISLYLVGSGIIPKEASRWILLIWSIVCLIGVFCIRIYGTADPRKRLSPQWAAVWISSIAFIIWVYLLGGPFIAFKLHIPYIGSLLVLAWTFFVPLFYQGSLDS